MKTYCETEKGNAEMGIKTVLKYETSESVGDVEERIDKTYHRYMSESSSSKDDFYFRSAENAAYPTFVCGSRKGKNGKERPEIIFGKRVCIEFRIKKKNEKKLVDVIIVNGWHKFLPVPFYSVLLLLCGVVLPPIAQYLIALGNETLFRGVRCFIWSYSVCASDRRLFSMLSHAFPFREKRRPTR